MGDKNNQARAEAIAATIRAIRSAHNLVAKLERAGALMAMEQTDRVAAVDDLRIAARTAHRAMLDAQEAIDLALDEEDACDGS